MFDQSEIEVLVVGAGPVGMFTALLLAEAGIKVQIIDEEWRTGAHSYACALHPATLGLFRQAGLAEEVLAAAHQLDTVGFYEGDARKAEVRLSALGGGDPFVAVLPQSTIEHILEQQLWRQGLKVRWNHRLSGLAEQGQTVTATIDKLGGTATGYIVPRWEWVVKRRSEVQPAFVVGADGHESMLRRVLGLAYESFDQATLYGVYELDLEEHLGHELRVVLGEGTCSALWPLPGNQCRWSLQLGRMAVPADFPAKERRPWRFYDEAVDRTTQAELEGVIRERAPWFQSKIKGLRWSIEVAFERRLARRFGHAHCWLAGDAGHQTSPVGMQSMNVGLIEAADLASRLRQILREQASPSLLEDYNRSRQQEWGVLLGMAGPPRTTPTTAAWVAGHGAQLLACLPASGQHLASLLRQMGLELPTTA